MSKQSTSVAERAKTWRRPRAVSGLPEALVWTAKKAAYTFLPPFVLHLIACAKGVYRFCTNDALRHYLTKGYGELLGPGQNRVQLLTLAHRNMQFRASLYLTGVILPQRMRLSDLVEFRGREHLDEALAQGKGALLLSAHLGYAHLIDMFLRRMGYPVRKLTNQPEVQSSYYVDRDLSRWPLLASIANRLIQFPDYDEPLITSLDVRPIYRLLEGNEALVLLADGLGSSRLVSSRLLEVPLLVSSGTLELGRSRGVPLLPAFLVREHLWSPRLKLIIQEPMQLQYTSDRDDDIQVNAGRFAQMLGRYVQAYPYLYEYHDFRELSRLSRASLEDRYSGSFSSAPE